MPDLMSRPGNEARYSLQIVGERDEFGLSENVYRFQACISGLAGQVDLSMMQGLLVRHEGRGDLCIEVWGMDDPSVRCKSVKVFEGEAASRLISRGVDVRVTLRARRLLFMHDPTILDIDSGHQPGTRLISALQRHFDGMDLDVVADLGTLESDEDFNEYFFPDTNLLGLRSQGIRLLQGRWGAAAREDEAYTFAVAYRPR